MFHLHSVTPEKPMGLEETLAPIKGETRLRPLTLALLLAWLGILFHDFREFGRPLIESSIAMGVFAALLFSFWQRRPKRRGIIAILMLAYAIINLVGALTSVLPLGVWPFEPEQSFEHYFSHAIWAVAELPLVWEMIYSTRSIRQEKRVSQGERAGKRS